MSELNKNNRYSRAEVSRLLKTVEGDDKTKIQNALTSVLNSFKAKYL